MERRRARYLRVESLETRRLLTANNCVPCDDMVEDGGIAEATISATGRNTLFGVAEPIVLDQARQVVEGGGAGPIDVYSLDATQPTPIRIDSRQDATFMLVPDARGADTVRSSAGVIETDLAAGGYLLYVFDVTSSSRLYELDVVLPNLQPVEEFPEVAYVGRDFDWNLNAVNAPEVWAQGFTGEGALVAVIDTGVDYLHPDLDDNIWRNPLEIEGDGIDNDGNGFVDDVRGWDFAYGDNDPIDRQGHGTHVAGTIAAERNGFGTTGVAYDATILPVKVLRDSGTGSPNAIAAGIRYAVDVGADVINLSLGGGVTRTLVNALQYAYANDVIVVAAAGNDGASRPGAPAIYSSVLSNTISVGAYDRNGQLAGFSNRVGGTDAVQVDAPGARVASTYPGGGYQYLSGTSMAAPHVAGVAALALSAGDLTSDDLRDLLVDGATGDVSRSDSVGGVNASRTVAQALVSRGAAVDATFASNELAVANSGSAQNFFATSAAQSKKSSIASAVEDLNKRRRSQLGIEPQGPNAAVEQPTA